MPSVTVLSDRSNPTWVHVNLTVPFPPCWTRADHPVLDNASAQASRARKNKHRIIAGWCHPPSHFSPETCPRLLDFLLCSAGTRRSKSSLQTSDMQSEKYGAQFRIRCRLPVVLQVKFDAHVEEAFCLILISKRLSPLSIHHAFLHRGIGRSGHCQCSIF